MNLVKLHTTAAKVGILVATVQHGYRAGAKIITEAAKAEDLKAKADRLVYGPPREDA